MLRMLRYITHTQIKEFVMFAIATLSIVLIVSLFSWYQFGSLTSAAAFFRGDRVFIDNPYQSLGTIPQHSNRETALIIVNRGDKPVSITGWNVSCGCTSIVGLPLTIPSGERRSIQMIVRPEKSSGSESHIKLFSDDKRHQTLDAYIQFTVISDDVISYQEPDPRAIAP